MKFEKINNVKIIPNIQTPIVYFLIDGEEVVYVGKSKSGLSRPFMHKNKIFTNIAFIECIEEDLDYYETKYIRKYDPKYNRKAGALELSFVRVKKLIREKTSFSDCTINDIKRIMKKLSIKTKELDGLKYVDEKDFDKIINFVRETRNTEENTYFWRNRFLK